MKKNLTTFACGLALLGEAATAPAQSTFNYFVTPVGGSNSRVTWNAAGSITTSPGVMWAASPGSFGGVNIRTAGAFNSSYAGMSQPLSIPTPDGSYFHNTELGQNFAINTYFAGVFGSTDIFGLVTAPATTAIGQHLTYAAGSQSVIIPIPFADFNVGTYQWTWASGTFFDTPVTVNLTVGAVPEPSTLALAIVSGLGLLLKFRRRK